jgi:hypothetical protein
LSPLGGINLQLIKGSYTNASRTAIKDSLLSRKTRMEISQVFLKLPSIPLTCKDSVMLVPYKKGCLAYLHRVCEHPRESKRYFFREFLAVHRHLEAVAKIDMDHFSRLSL